VVECGAGAIGEGDFGAGAVGHELLCDGQVVGGWGWLLLLLALPKHVRLLWWSGVGNVESGQTLVESAVPGCMVTAIIWAGRRLLYHRWEYRPSLRLINFHGTRQAAREWRDRRHVVETLDARQASALARSGLGSNGGLGGFRSLIV